MKTNRDEILRNSLGVFAGMNYERASITELARACGLSRMGIHHYYPNKLAVFTAVADRYIFDAQSPLLKYGEHPRTFVGVIDRTIEAIRQTMERIGSGCNLSGGGDAHSPSFRYMNFLFQVRQYYPDVERKFEKLQQETQTYWYEAVVRGIESGELRKEIVPENTAGMFHQIHFGLSFEMAFGNGLDTELLRRQFMALYALIRTERDE